MAATVGVELDHQFAQLRAVVDQLADDPAWQGSDDQVLHRVDELGWLINRLTGIRLQEIHEAHRNARRPRAVIAIQYNDLLAGIRGGCSVASGQPVTPARHGSPAPERYSRQCSTGCP